MHHLNLLGQLWTLNTDTQFLENKNFPENKAYIWDNQTELKWNLPDEGQEGYMEDASSGLVLSIDLEGAIWKAILEPKNDTNEQKWFRRNTTDKYFTLENKETKRFLTAKSNFTTWVEGNCLLFFF